MMEYTKLGEVNTVANTPPTETLNNIKRNLKREYPRLHKHHSFGKIKKSPIALVGGGPSLKNTLSELNDFTVLACGSVHDYLQENDVLCAYTVVCDPDPISANYLKKPSYYTTYLVSTGCDDKVYEALDTHDIYMWNCFSDEIIKEQMSLEKDFHAVAGGCTVGLRSLSIALMLGYSDIHFFGFDSCLGINNQHHAYDFSDNSEELGEIYKVKIGTDKEIYHNKEFVCAGYHVAQARQFDDFYKKYHQYFEATFHGEGLLPELMRINKIENTGDKSRALKTLITQPEGTVI